MSDITERTRDTASPGSAGIGGPGDDTRAQPDVRSVAPGYRRSATLDALQELVDVAGAMPHEVARRSGMSTSELHSLRYLIATPMGPVDLARALDVTSAAASGVVDRLVAHGHAERTAHPQDGRRRQVVITERGRLEALTMLAPMFRSLAALDASLGDDDRAVVERYLNGATAAMRELM
ncbi:MAG: MarR family transcriptional regulator [Ornithinibacter sp.]